MNPPIACAMLVASPRLHTEKAKLEHITTERRFRWQAHHARHSKISPAQPLLVFYGGQATDKRHTHRCWYWQSCCQSLDYITALQRHFTSWSQGQNLQCETFPSRATSSLWGCGCKAHISTCRPSTAGATIAVFTVICHRSSPGVCEPPAAHAVGL